MIKPNRKAQGQPWYAEGLCFECTKCGKCCTGPPGTVTFSELEGRAMARELKMDFEEFLYQYAFVFKDNFYLREEEGEFGFDCVLLDRKKKSAPSPEVAEAEGVRSGQEQSEAAQVGAEAEDGVQAQEDAQAEDGVQAQEDAQAEDGAQTEEPVLCKVHKSRPMQCRTWPFWPDTLRSPKTWEQAGRRCPGINRGQKFNLQTISDNCQKTPWS